MWVSPPLSKEPSGSPSPMTSAFSLVAFCKNKHRCNGEAKFVYSQDGIYYKLLQHSIQHCQNCNSPLSSPSRSHDSLAPFPLPSFPFSYPPKYSSIVEHTKEQNLIPTHGGQVLPFQHIVKVLLEIAIRSWVHCGHKRVDMVSNNNQVGCGI